MNKAVSASELKAKCLKFIDEIQRNGQPITVTKCGKVVAELTPKRAEPLPSVIGMLRSPEYRFDWYLSEPAANPAGWEALR